LNRRRSDDESRLVWSSDPDGTAQCDPPADGRASTRRAGDGPVTVARENKGDQREAVVAELAKRGWTVKRTEG